MATEPINFLAQSIVDELASGISGNLNRYLEGDFMDLARNSGWAIETKFARWDPAIAAKLDPVGGAEAEIRNSLLIYKGFEGMTPALAREERLWARLCHVDCLDFARKRWLDGAANVENQARLHFFAPSLAACRDDNAVGRLWWNGHIAQLASPDDVEGGLRKLLSRANIRLQIVDRADTAFRQPLIQGIFRLLGNEHWFNSYDAAIADFMFEVNKRSGGIVFEALEADAVDKHLELCLEHAKLRKAG